MTTTPLEESNCATCGHLYGYHRKPDEMSHVLPRCSMRMRVNGVFVDCQCNGFKVHEPEFGSKEWVLQRIDELRSESQAIQRYLAELEHFNREIMKAVLVLAEKFVPQSITCRGCGTDISQCGPRLWEQQQTCCPDCTHAAPCNICSRGPDHAVHRENARGHQYPSGEVGHAWTA